MEEFKHSIGKSRGEPWDEIQEYYTKLFKGSYNESIVLLVNHIIATKLSSRLFACTILNRLIISIYDPIEVNRESLHILFDIYTKQWTFEYYSKPFQTTQTFVRKYEQEKGIEKFDAFIKMIGW